MSRRDEYDGIRGGIRRDERGVLRFWFSLLHRDEFFRTAAAKGKEEKDLFGITV